MKDAERKQISKLFDDKAILLFPSYLDDEPMVDASAVNNNIADIMLDDEEIDYFIVAVKHFVEEGCVEDYFDFDILDNANCEYAISMESCIELEEDFDDFCNKLRENGYTVYTPETFDEYLKSKGVSATFDDLKTW